MNEDQKKEIIDAMIDMRDEQIKEMKSAAKTNGQSSPGFNQSLGWMDALNWALEVVEEVAGCDE